MEMGAIKTPPPSARPEMTAALMAETGLNADLLRDLVHRSTAASVPMRFWGRSLPRGSPTGPRIWTAW